MIHSFRKFFEFAGRQSRNWYLGLFYEIIRCILEALQFAALLVVLDGLVHDNITAQTALLAFGIMLVSVIGTAIFWYLAHGKEGEGSYRMCEDKRIQIGNRMKYMPMGYFNSHSLGNLTSVSTATMSDLESMSFAVIGKVTRSHRSSRPLTWTTARSSLRSVKSRTGAVQSTLRIPTPRGNVPKTNVTTGCFEPSFRRACPLRLSLLSISWLQLMN